MKYVDAIKLGLDLVKKELGVDGSSVIPELVSAIYRGREAEAIDNIDSLDLVPVEPSNKAKDAKFKAHVKSEDKTYEVIFIDFVNKFVGIDKHDENAGIIMVVFDEIELTQYMGDQ